MNAPECMRENVPLGRLTSFGIGGPARWFAEPVSRAEVVECLAFAREVGMPVLVLGGGTNLLVADAGVEAVVIRLGGGEFSAVRVEIDHPLVWRVGAAASLQELVVATAREGVKGLEFMAGIPGRVGGAVAMNSGGSDEDIGEWVESAEVYDVHSGAFSLLSKDELKFSYRSSAVKGKLAVAFTLVFSERADPEKLSTRMREYRERKKAAQPLMVPSAGCIFKNPPGDSAGALLELAGVKLRRKGGAQVSGLHANFIINHGHAGSGDVAVLAALMREQVYRNSGIVLEPEVALWGEDSTFSDLRKPLGGGEGGQA